MNHRTWIAVILALLAGLALGNWAPRADLKRLQKEVDDLKKQTARQSAKASDIGRITTMLNMPEREAGKTADRRHRHNIDTPPAIAASSTNQPASTVVVTNRHQSMKESISAAKEMWETRSALARSSFISNIKASSSQTTNFDVIVEDMNLRLGTAIDKWATVLKAQESIKPEQGIRMMNDLSGIMVATYDEMDRKMPADWQKNAGEDFQLFNLIDPDVATPLVEMEGRFNPGANQHGLENPQNPGRNPNISVEIK